MFPSICCGIFAVALGFRDIQRLVFLASIFAGQCKAQSPLVAKRPPGVIQFQWVSEWVCVGVYVRDVFFPFQQLTFFESWVTCVSCNVSADGSSPCFACVRFTAWWDARGQHDWQVPGRGEPNCDRVLSQEQQGEEDWILGNRRWKEPHDSGTVKGKAGAVLDWQCGVLAWCTTLASLHRHVARTGSCSRGRQVPANLPASSGNQQSSSRSRECGHST